jgi:hypothetical protein
MKLLQLGNHFFPASEIQLISSVREEDHNDYLFYYIINVQLKGGRVLKWQSKRCNRTTPDWNVHCMKQAQEVRFKLRMLAWPDAECVDLDHYSNEESND